MSNDNEKKRRLPRKYVPAKPTGGMCDGVPLTDYKVSAAEHNYGYKGSGYYLTRLAPVENSIFTEPTRDNVLIKKR